MFVSIVVFVILGKSLLYWLTEDDPSFWLNFAVFFFATAIGYLVHSVILRRSDQPKVPSKGEHEEFFKSKWTSFLNSFPFKLIVCSVAAAVAAVLVEWMN